MCSLQVKQKYTQAVHLRFLSMFDMLDDFRSGEPDISHKIMRPCPGVNGEAEVQEERLVGLIEDDVLRLDVAMQDMARV